VGLGRRVRENRTFWQAFARRKRELIVRLGQRRDRVRHCIKITRSPALLTTHRTHRSLQLIERKAIVDQRHHLLDKAIREHQFDELALKQAFLVLGVRFHIRRGYKSRRRIEHDSTILIDDTRSERDRRYMPLARGPQAENEPLRSLWKVRLIWVPDHRRIE